MEGHDCMTLQHERWDIAFDRIQEIFEDVDEVVISKILCIQQQLSLMEVDAVDKLRRQVLPISKDWSQQLSMHSNHYTCLSILTNQNRGRREKNRHERIGPVELFFESKLHPILKSIGGLRKLFFNVSYRSVNEISIPHVPSQYSQVLFSTIGYSAIDRNISGFREGCLKDVFSVEGRRTPSPVVSCVGLHPITNELFFCCNQNSTIQVLTSDRKSTYTIDVGRKSEFKLDRMSHISFSPDGRVCALTICSDHRILLFKCEFQSLPVSGSDLTFHKCVGRLGNRPGEFAYPEAVVFSNSGEHFYVADRNNEVVQKFTFDGNFIQIIGTRDRRSGFGPVIGLVNVGHHHIGVLTNRYRFFRLISAKTGEIENECRLPESDGIPLFITPGLNQGFVVLCSTGSVVSIIFASKDFSYNTFKFTHSPFRAVIFDLYNNLYFVPERLHDIKVF